MRDQTLWIESLWCQRNQEWIETWGMGNTAKIVGESGETENAIKLLESESSDTGSSKTRGNEQTLKKTKKKKKEGRPTSLKKKRKKSLNAKRNKTAAERLGGGRAGKNRREEWLLVEGRVKRQKRKPKHLKGESRGSPIKKSQKKKKKKTVAFSTTNVT